MRRLRHVDLHAFRALVTTPLRAQQQVRRLSMRAGAHTTHEPARASPRHVQLRWCPCNHASPNYLRFAKSYVCGCPDWGLVERCLRYGAGTRRTDRRPNAPPPGGPGPAPTSDAPGGD
eukprot:4565588-Prymnesium_polylepis.1